MPLIHFIDFCLTFKFCPLTETIGFVHVCWECVGWLFAYTASTKAWEVIAIINVSLCNIHHHSYDRKFFYFAMYMFRLNFDDIIINLYRWILFSCWQTGLKNNPLLTAATVIMTTVGIFICLYWPLFLSIYHEWPFLLPIYFTSDNPILSYPLSFISGTQHSKYWHPDFELRAIHF